MDVVEFQEVLQVWLSVITEKRAFKLSLTAFIILSAVNLRYTTTDLIIKAVNFLISS